MKELQDLNKDRIEFSKSIIKKRTDQLAKAKEVKTPNTTASLNHDESSLELIRK